MIQTDNAILKLASQIREGTYGMCRVGPGPYGFGVCNTNPANIAIVLRVTPNPFEDKALPPEAKAITITVEGYFKSNPTKALDEDAVQQLGTGRDYATLVIATTLMELSKASIVVSKDECDTAFDLMAQQDINGMIGLTQEEAQKIANTYWYIEKTTKEIVDFQLYEPHLCMPFDEFHKALETVLGRSIIADEFAHADRLQAEYSNCKDVVAKQSMADNDTYADAGLKLGGLHM